MMPEPKLVLDGMTVTIEEVGGGDGGVVIWACGTVESNDCGYFTPEELEAVAKVARKYRSFCKHVNKTLGAAIRKYPQEDPDARP